MVVATVVGWKPLREAELYSGNAGHLCQLILLQVGSRPFLPAVAQDEGIQKFVSRKTGLSRRTGRSLSFL